MYDTCVESGGFQHTFELIKQELKQLQCLGPTSMLDTSTATHTLMNTCRAALNSSLRRPHVILSQYPGKGEKDMPIPHIYYCHLLFLGLPRKKSTKAVTVVWHHASCMVAVHQESSIIIHGAVVPLLVLLHPHITDVVTPPLPPRVR